MENTTKKETSAPAKVPTPKVEHKAEVVKDIYSALADFQQEVPAIHKSTEGYGYSYADLASVFEIINPLLKKHGLGFTQPLDGYKLRTILFHTPSGTKIESSVDIPQDVELAKMNDFQVLGSAITYLRRYSLSSILGLVTDADDDAQGEQVNTKVKNEPTEKQISLIHSLKEKKGYTSEDISEALAIKKGDPFTGEVASRIIKWLLEVAPNPNDPIIQSAQAVDRGENV